MRLMPKPNQEKPNNPKRPRTARGIRTKRLPTIRLPNIRLTSIRWSHILKGTFIAVVILLFLLMATLICTPDTQHDIPEELIAPGLEMPPIKTQAQVSLTKEEIEMKTGEYMALNLWAENAQTTAIDDSGNFLKVMFSVPEMECVGNYRQVMKNRPVIFPEPIQRENSTLQEYEEYQVATINAQTKLREVQKEHLIECTWEGFQDTETKPWEGLTPDEQEARARRAVRLLAQSIDPTLLMSTNIAATKGLGVDSQNNPEFAQFAAQYDTCQVQADGFALPLARAKTPEKMSELWLNAYQHLTECFNNITELIFPTRPQVQPAGP